MNAVEEDFRATAESVAADAEQLRGIEEQKARLEPEDPRRAELSEDAALVAEEIRKKTTVELELEAEAEAAAPDAGR